MLIFTLLSLLIIVQCSVILATFLLNCTFWSAPFADYLNCAKKASPDNVPSAIINKSRNKTYEKYIPKEFILEMDEDEKIDYVTQAIFTAPNNVQLMDRRLLVNEHLSKVNSKSNISSVISKEPKPIYSELKSDFCSLITASFEPKFSTFIALKSPIKSKTKDTLSIKKSRKKPKKILRNHKLSRH